MGVPAAAVIPHPREASHTVRKATVAVPPSVGLNPPVRWPARRTSGIEGGRGGPNFAVNGEMFRPAKDDRWRRQATSTRLTVRIESMGIKKDQIPL